MLMTMKKTLDLVYLQGAKQFTTSGGAFACSTLMDLFPKIDNTKTEFKFSASPKRFRGSRTVYAQLGSSGSIYWGVRKDKPHYSTLTEFGKYFRGMVSEKVNNEIWKSEKFFIKLEPSSENH